MAGYGKSAHTVGRGPWPLRSAADRSASRARGGVDGEGQYVTGKSEPEVPWVREETPAWPPGTQWAINAHHRRGCLALVAATQLCSRHRMARNRERATRPPPLRSQAGTPRARAAPLLLARRGTVQSVIASSLRPQMRCPATCNHRPCSFDC